MSENTFPFDADQAVTYVDATDGERNQRALLVAGGLVAALVLGVGGFLLLSGSGDSEDDAFVPVKRAPRAAAVAPTPKPVVKLPVAFNEQIGRDPFRALYVAPVLAAAAGPAVPPPVTTTAVTSGTSTSTGTGPVTPVAARYPLKLVSISDPSPEVRTSTWTVDGKKETVLPAQRFGKYGELVVLAFTKNAKGVVDGAVLQVGDDSPMEVKVGESNSVL